MTEVFAPTKWLRLRARIALGVMLCVFGLLCYRAFHLQVRQATHFRNLAEDQYLHDVEVAPRRGKILDRTGELLASTAEIESLYVNPRVIGNKSELAARLSPILDLSTEDLEKKLSAKGYFAWIKRRISAEESRAIADLGINGLMLAKEPRRYYPNRTLAGPLLGWANIDAVGQEGIELSYNRWLRGKKVQLRTLRDALGRVVLTGGMGEGGSKDGYNIETTIDRHIQFRLEESLAKALAKHRAKAAVAVVLDPTNGEVLAMASLPSVNPNSPDGAHQRGVRNRAVTDPFEPGSTMKTFTIAGALEAKVIKLEDNWYCENGKYKIGPATIHDAEKIGDATTTQVLAESSNICTAKIAMRLGKEKMREVFLRFGFGRPTKIDLPGERAGQVRNLQTMGPVESATMSFGQGLTATPIQLAAAYASIANGGTWITPHVVRRVLDERGTVIDQPKPERRTVLSADMAQTMRDMLYAVSQKGGTAAGVKVPGYTFGGKTGTAQKVDPATHRYSADNWSSSFVGFAPIDHPRLVLFVMVDEPRGTHFGSQVAGPVFAETMADALRWLSVTPDLEMPEVVADKTLRALPVLSGEVVADEDPVAEGEVVVPDFSGMAMGQAFEAAQRAGVRMNIKGSGFAHAQHPGPGKAKAGVVCQVAFAPPG